MTSDREHIISAEMLGVGNRYGDASERFAVSEEIKAARLGRHRAARVWHIVARRLHILHDIGRPLGRARLPH